MQIKTILNRIQKHGGFVYGMIQLEEQIALPNIARYPSYGPDWRNSSRASVALLEALGMYELAAAQEAFTRSHRSNWQRPSLNGAR
jgi:hypothetical protein